MLAGFQRLGVFLGLVATLVAGGGHWVLLQSLAWASMIVEYSTELPLDTAVARALDGKRPCRWCLAIRHGQQQERKTQSLAGPRELDLLHPPAARNRRPVAAAVANRTPYRSNLHLDFIESPRRPPPRCG